MKFKRWFSVLGVLGLMMGLMARGRSRKQPP